MEEKKKYQNPLTSRYSSKEMSKIFSPVFMHSTWRRLWISLAKVEKELGTNVTITDEQIKEMEDNQELNEEDYKIAKEFERELRHDVMSHVNTFGKKCPKAKGIIHLGATSCFVKDNTGLVQMLEGLKLIREKLLNVILILKDFCKKHAELPTLGFTHFQPAQLVTVGKRGCLWLQDFVYDLQEIENKIELLENSFRGVKGTTGTQASFLELFEGDHEKVKKLDEEITQLMGFKKPIGVSGQTYTRKLDYLVLSCISGVAQSAHKFAVDMRLLMNLKELEEPFSKKQIGSSAMAYKRNPMRSERICALSRFVISLTNNAAHTHSNQWFERTLDDSANRRLTIAQSFLGVDGILKVVANVADGMVVYPFVIRKNLMESLPFMVTENVIVDACNKGGDRQEAHEKIRVLSNKAIKQVKEKGGKNELLKFMKEDPYFVKLKVSFDDILDPTKLIGRAKEQTFEYISEYVDPLLKKYCKLKVKKEKMNV